MNAKRNEGIMHSMHMYAAAWACDIAKPVRFSQGYWLVDNRDYLLIRVTLRGNAHDRRVARRAILRGINAV